MKPSTAGDLSIVLCLTSVLFPFSFFCDWIFVLVFVFVVIFVFIGKYKQARRASLVLCLTFACALFCSIQKKSFVPRLLLWKFPPMDTNIAFSCTECVTKLPKPTKTNSCADYGKF